MLMIVDWYHRNLIKISSTDWFLNPNCNWNDMTYDFQSPMTFRLA